MHRFRKKSDVKRSQVPDFLSGPAPQDSLPELPVPELPPASNFRTSLILPDLSRRFTLLRTSTGDPVSLSDLRTRFAEQRARGAKNQISEEEEIMILETLGRMRPRNARNGENVDAGLESSSSHVDLADSDYQTSTERQSVQSSNTAASIHTHGSVPPSPNGRPSKRYSNNLFGSGRFRDYSYVRSVASQRSTRTTNSITPTESSFSLRGNSAAYSDILRPVTPDGSARSSSVQSSPNEKTPMVRSAPLLAPTPYTESSESEPEYRLSKNLNPAALKRASLALEEAIKEIEEEAEDEIVMPRSTPIPRGPSGDQKRVSSDTNPTNSFRSSTEIELGTAISSDKQIALEISEPQPSSPIPHRPGTASPTPRLPGYIPGMPRPMTPRSLEADELSRSHSTTPRATSPIIPGPNEYSSPVIPATLPSSILRRGSNASTSRQSPRSNSPSISSPLFLPRSTNGRFTPEDSQRGDNIPPENLTQSSLAGRRRPASPLSGPAFQSMTVTSRPSTPSNVTWNPSSTSSDQKGHSRTDSASVHSRNGSVVGSDAGMHSDMQSALERSKSSTRSLRSPALPDSPLIDRGSNMNAFGWNTPGGQSAEDRPPSTISGVELGSPIMASNHGFRSITPTQTTSRSPVSPSFSSNDSPQANGSRRSSKQNSTSSPFNSLHPLVLSPIANSSRSSLESEGSSYHSWDAEHKRDHSLKLFSDMDPSQPAWHDLNGADQSTSATPGGSQDDGWYPEDIIRRYAGLSKFDFVAIQKKLVGASAAKDTTPDGRERAPSLRRRRPSTSMSNHSLNGRENRVASPPPRTQSPASPKRVDIDSAAKATTLLDSVVDSIQSPYVNNLATEGKVNASQTSAESASPTRRNLDLAQALFGVQDQPPSSNSTVTPDSSASPGSFSRPTTGDTSFSSNAATPTKEDRSSSPFTAATQRSHNLSTPQISQHIGNQAELEKDVQRRADAAMVALRKIPSNPKLAGATSPGGTVSRKKIAPHQISTPRLVSASTSVDTIPLHPPSVTSGNQGSSKLGQRFRKLRGTIRKAPAPTGEEVTPYPLDLRSAPPGQSTNFIPSTLKSPGAPATASATELGRFKVPIASPPASAGPGLKGFISRFRKSRAAETLEHERQASSFTGSQIASVSTFLTTEPSNPQQARSAPADRDSFQKSSPRAPSRSPAAPIPERIQGSDDNTGEPPGDDKDAVRQLFVAASKVGLDPGALNDLLVRSTSTSSRATDWTRLTRNNSVATTSRPQTQDDSTDRIRSPAPSESRPSGDGFVQQGNETVVRKISVRKRSDNARPPREGQDGDSALNAIVRRTIIFPSESRTSTIDLNALMRKNSQSARRRRSASAASVHSSRSVHDRAPTPPPPRSPTGRRFSTDKSPPVPQLPPSFSSQAENMLQDSQSASAVPIEKSSSAYDSLYEMYAGESKSTAIDSNGPDILHQSDALPPSDSGPAVEVIELANGETIWSIVNGLRDDDAESSYGNRASFVSEYSLHDTSNEGVQLFFKEHGRKISKESTSSFLSPRKLPQGKSRPETKVFYSSSAQIGRLIENISQGMDSGSFNIMPDVSAGRSNPSSFHSDGDIHWTVEERLEHMLGTMGNS